MECFTYGYSRSFHQIRNAPKEEVLCILLRESYTYKPRSDLNITSDAIECLCIEVINKHKPPKGDTT